MRSLFHTIMGKGASAPAYPASLKLFIDAGNPASYPGSGTTVTDLIGTQNGTLVNGVGYSSSNGGYFTFDATNDYIDFGINALLQPTTARTVSLWAVVNTGGNGVIYSDYTVATGRNGLLFNYDSAFGRYFFLGTTGLQFIPNTITQNVWTYITMSFNGSNIYTYRNGVLINSATQNYTMINGVNKTTIGDTFPSSQPLNGKIAQMKIYNTCLTDAEVLTDFNEFKARYGY